MLRLQNKSSQMAFATWRSLVLSFIYICIVDGKSANVNAGWLGLLQGLGGGGM